MRGRGKASKAPKKKEWGTGDLDERDEELFKHLPNPEEIPELLHPTEELLKADAKRAKRKGKRR